MAKKDIGRVTADPVAYQISAPAGDVRIQTFISWTLVKRGVMREVITPIDSTEQFAEEAEEKRTRLNRQDCALIRAISGQPVELFSLSFSRVS